ncbi:uncharacterized protein MONOS_8665 [Monocercomonoides exilis]|uniref:uncharacterized protein n=1 Tax=Monocercomonoides exilis TaxID=2049356 RepID=UPI0035597DB8|nr:hypothetical protein MONOS_8665 [Monocercomonoides exilis]|eukprot:MONOS_8665.1-p1 / transcript=MONOS_8665.1 / gene=MONOS_8665 / organism=Monocercomonoides_exilis_PA203 / gene_product=unspecified product / transcript_product=unspecified product / location=Mono_scaffold00333:2346-4774(+) / protein_length=770 / sequence_SO=supercontig / SO=protein_coding / is_pseudo=false
MFQGFVKHQLKRSNEGNGKKRFEAVQLEYQNFSQKFAENLEINPQISYSLSEIKNISNGIEVKASKHSKYFEGLPKKRLHTNYIHFAINKLQSRSTSDEKIEPEGKKFSELQTLKIKKEESNKQPNEIMKKKKEIIDYPFEQLFKLTEKEHVSDQSTAEGNEQPSIVKMLNSLKSLRNSSKDAPTDDQMQMKSRYITADEKFLDFPGLSMGMNRNSDLSERMLHKTLTSDEKSSVPNLDTFDDAAVQQRVEMLWNLYEKPELAKDFCLSVYGEEGLRNNKDAAELIAGSENDPVVVQAYAIMQLYSLREENGLPWNRYGKWNVKLHTNGLRYLSKEEMDAMDDKEKARRARKRVLPEGYCRRDLTKSELQQLYGEYVPLKRLRKLYAMCDYPQYAIEIFSSSASKVDRVNIAEKFKEKNNVIKLLRSRQNPDELRNELQLKLLENGFVALNDRDFTVLDKIDDEAEQQELLNRSTAQTSGCDIASSSSVPSCVQPSNYSDSQSWFINVIQRGYDNPEEFPRLVSSAPAQFTGTEKVFLKMMSEVAKIQPIVFRSTLLIYLMRSKGFGALPWNREGEWDMRAATSRLSFRSASQISKMSDSERMWRTKERVLPQPYRRRMLTKEEKKKLYRGCVPNAQEELLYYQYDFPQHYVKLSFCPAFFMNRNVVPDELLSQDVVYEMILAEQNPIFVRTFTRQRLEEGGFPRPAERDFSVMISVDDEAELEEIKRRKQNGEPLTKCLLPTDPEPQSASFTKRINELFSKSGLFDFD